MYAYPSFPLPGTGNGAINLPVNIEAEQAVLGTVLLDQPKLDELGFLDPSHFHDPVHADIYGICVDRHSRGEIVSAVALKPVLGGHAGLQELGGIDYLARLTGVVISPSVVGEYAKQLVELFARRIMEIADGAIRIASSEDPEATASAALEHLDCGLETIREQTQRKPGSVSFAQAAAAAMERMKKARESGLGIPTGIPALDGKICGVHPGDLTVIAGRPGMGKSAVGITIAERIATRGPAVILASLEMPAEDLAIRVASDTIRAGGGRLPYSEIRRGTVSDDEAGLAIETSDRIRKLPIHIVGGHIRRVTHLLAEFRRLIRRLRSLQQEIGAVIVDHIGLVEVLASSDNARITMITSALKGFAMESGVPVIAISRLNRRVEARDDKRPRLSDLRDSGSIEQDADNVLFCYRPEYYLERAEPDPSDPQAVVAWEVIMDSARNLLEIGVAKQRNGPVGTVKLGCELAHNYIFEWGA